MEQVTVYRRVGLFLIFVEDLCDIRGIYVPLILSQICIDCHESTALPGALRNYIHNKAWDLSTRAEGGHKDWSRYKIEQQRYKRLGYPQKTNKDRQKIKNILKIESKTSRSSKATNAGPKKYHPYPSIVVDLFYRLDARTRD